ncbi:ACT domain-containing protein [Neomegalonema sp.]|uniref:ACT domain-containing protein n=1 Tax=Neomegalonema sp. TaxID=2039713 RepID=UPI00262B9AC3|nr:ACT domain-containing protein [Neomegalonema sp.]MDD2868730.1 ACT domain-containing protein [Neomegalonema sp.]
MSGPVLREARAMIAGLNPKLQPGAYVFCAPPEALTGACAAAALASFREPEGPSFLLPAATAEALGLEASPPMGWIILKVFSSLEGVGLTAAVAQALAARGIPCNMVAALRHDHVFTPLDRAEEALKILRALQAEA